MDRRRSEAGSVTPTQGNPDVFDDEFAVDEFDIVADGFRPDNNVDGSERHSQDPPIRTASAHYATNPALTLAPTTSNRDSMQKTRVHDNPFSSPDDEPRMEFERTESMSSYAPGIARRSGSSASHNFDGMGSSRFGAGGPSHPYDMYPQGTIPRSPSVATSSTTQPLSRWSTLRHGPQHPYAMYPQGVGAEDIEEDATVPVAVGFPGLGGQNYQRIRGPDGEEQDIIGADGHTEQLPPYSRYPEDGPKMPLLAVPGELHSRGPVAGNDPSMPLMHTPLVPQPQQTNSQLSRQSMTDQSVLDRHSMIDRGVDRHASESLLGSETDDSLASNKSWKEKSWKEKRRTKFCGVPFWIFMIVGGIAGFIIAVVGGVVGGYYSGTSQAKSENVVTVVSTSLYDASLIASPTMAPPTGTYALSLSPPEETRANCLVDPAQAQAWDCDLSGNPALAISVGVPTGPKPTSGAYLFYASSDTEICYGTQYQFMATDFSPFLTVQDNDDPENGPAFYFEQTYDKVVVLPESAFPVPTPSSSGSKIKRQGWDLPQGWGEQKNFVNPGEKPWFCVWNNTFLEGFIYVQEPIAASWTATASTLSPTSISANSSVQTGTSGLSSTQVSGGTYSVSPTSATPAPTAIPMNLPFTGSDTTMTLSNDETTTTVTATSDFPIPTWYDHDPSHRYHNTGDNDDNGSEEHATRRRRNQRRQVPDDMFSQLPMYPYIIKLEERRLAGNQVQPYCQQYQILENGQYNWLPDENENPIIIQLNEQDPTYAAYQSAGTAGSRKERRQNVPNGCHCQWTSGE